MDNTALCLASDNQGKLKEMRALLASLPLTLKTQSEFGLCSAEETGLTFVENALLKAQFAAKHSSLPCIADDSGLCVDNLSGAPGIYSSRFAGPTANGADNIEHLLKNLVAHKNEKITAYYYCVIVYIRSYDDPRPLICQGQWQGEITFQAAGSEGFGYDPIFYLPEHQCTAAQLSTEKKNALSHRAQALQQLQQQLLEHYA